MKNIEKFKISALFAVILISVYIFFFYPVNSKIGFGNIKNQGGEFEQEAMGLTGETNVLPPNRALVAMGNQVDPNVAGGTPPTEQALETQGTQGAWKGENVQNPMDTFQTPSNVQVIANNNAALARDPFGLQQIAAPVPTKTMPVTVPDKILQEGHWIGLEVVPLTKALARANNISTKIDGVLIDEVTLLSAEVGLVAGDVITEINGKKVFDLTSFKEATRPVANIQQAIVKVYRNNGYYEISVYGPDVLGIAQMEAAPMINPTSPSPHGYYGACANCHTLTNGPLNTGQLAKDLGDQLLKIPPPIKVGLRTAAQE